ncbi:MAG: hypothetical protein R2755_26525 [Acidimicrobiales bacterium]
MKKVLIVIVMASLTLIVGIGINIISGHFELPARRSTQIAIPVVVVTVIATFAYVGIDLGGSSLGLGVVADRPNQSPLPTAESASTSSTGIGSDSTLVNGSALRPADLPFDGKYDSGPDAYDYAFAFPAAWLRSSPPAGSSRVVLIATEAPTSVTIEFNVVPASAVPSHYAVPKGSRPHPAQRRQDPHA